MADLWAVQVSMQKVDDAVRYVYDIHCLAARRPHVPIFFLHLDYSMIETFSSRQNMPDLRVQPAVVNDAPYIVASATRHDLHKVTACGYCIVVPDPKMVAYLRIAKVHSMPKTECSGKTEWVVVGSVEFENEIN